MASSASSALSRYRPSVIATAGLATAGSLYLVYCLIYRGPDLPSGPPLHRSNAIRGRHGSLRAATVRDLDSLDQLIEHAEQALNSAANETNDAVAAVDGTALEALESQADTAAADEAETEQSLDEPAATREGSRLQELVYAIAKSNSEKEGIVHRGVTCDKCNRVPIVGVRYHCANCPDYDLCEDCEATDCHLKTHVFYKVKVPSPWGGKKPLPLWYPGDPTSMPSEIEDRAYKNRLAHTTGFPITKIDGLYQQFTCMANVRVNHPEQPSLRMGIDRNAFDHCFIGQTMTETRPTIPNLIHDRLFAFYDSNGDGIVDFSEFVVGTSLVHSKSKQHRSKRVFRGLDLDDDGLISRKDCLKIFRAYYELNKDIMLGYLGIEREGENADLVIADRDPARHVASGRSLASYFNDGAPGGYQTNSGTSEKVLNSFNDYVLSSDQVEPIADDFVSDHHDLMTKEEVTESGWLNLFAIYNDEIFRLCGGKPLKWLNGTHARIFARTSTRGSQRDMIEHNGQLWAADATYFGKSAYIRIEDEDVQGLWSSNEQRPKLSDPTSHLTVHAVARHRLCLAIRDTMLVAGVANREERKNLDQFYLDETGATQNYYEKFGDWRRHSTGNEVPNRGDEKVEDSQNSNHAPTEQGHTTPLTEREQWDRWFVGGSAAAHTIYNVVEESLIELLDPLFKPSERLFLEVQNSISSREQYKAEISTYLETCRKKLVPLVPDSSDDVKTPNQVADAFKNFLRTLKDPDDVRRDDRLLKSALENWVAEPVERGTFSDVDAVAQGFLMWLLEIEAELMVGWEISLDPGPTTTDTRSDANQGTATASSNKDPTMPQHRPSQEDADDITEMTEGGTLSSDEVLRLARLEAAAQNIERKGKPGLLDFVEFERKMELTDENGDTLLQWIGGWVDLVMF